MFELRRFMSEFVRYANTILPWTSDDGVFSVEVRFALIRGRLDVVAQLVDCTIDDGMSPYTSAVIRLLLRSVSDLNEFNAIATIGKERTFVLSVNPHVGGVVYGVGGA